MTTLLRAFIRKRLLSAVVLSVVLVSSAFAGNTGKIAGVVKDKQTDEPLIGVNVIIKGTTLGGSTDREGRYFILQVPPGSYELTISLIGYNPVRVTDVKVQVDLTTSINVSLESTVLQGPEVVITAEKKMVQKDVTSTRRTVSRENMLETPGLEKTTDIFALQGGAFIGTGTQTVQLADGTQLQVRDESLKDIHVRGGRGGELLYLVDGVPVTHPIYGGRDVLELNKVDVEQVELLTGAFNAEYGQAQSGVVNITTRSGGESFGGGAEYKTDAVGFLGEVYKTDYASLYLSGPEPLSRYLLPEMGINAPGDFTYFVSANATLTNTPYNNNRNREQFSFLGMKLTQRQDNTGSLNAKLKWDATGELHLTTSYQGSWKSWSNFDWLWKYFPNNTASYARTTHNLTLHLNHVLSKSTFYDLNVGLLSVSYNGSFNGTDPADFWRVVPVYDSTGAKIRDSVYSTIKSPSTDPLNGFYDNLGFENIWRDDLSRTYTFKLDLTSQAHPAHLVKAGVEVKYNDIQYVDIQDGGTKLSNYGEYLYRGGPYFTPPPGPFKEFGQNRWVFLVKPTIGSAYVQDKFELEFLIINAGARIDWFNASKSVMDPSFKTQWEAATGLKPAWDQVKSKVSPRFGISYPISERTVVFFSYGHFVQLPELQYYYRDPYSGGFTGNPGLDFEQTILYEFGLTHQLSDYWAFDVKSYQKDISKQIGTTHLRAALGIPVDVYDNNGYARARGLEFQLTKAPADFTSGTLTYTVQWANGYSSSAFEDYIRSINDFPNPIRERRLGWDVRHEVIFQGTVSAGENEHPDLFGIKLPDFWNLTVLTKYTTGQPYTPFTLDPAEAQVKENSETGPPSSSTDLRLTKTFSLGGPRLSLVLDMFNIFNQKNVQIGFGFNTYTGKPYKYGDTIPPTNQVYDWYTMFRIMDPRQFSTGRTAKVGLRIDW